MKKTLSMFLSVLMLLTMLIVPVNFVSAETPDWSATLDDRYVFDFTNVGCFTDQLSKSDGSGVQLDSTLPWKETVTFDAGQGRGNRTVYPVYTHMSGNNWGPQSWSQPGSVTVDDQTVSSLELTANHSSNDYFVPLKADGTPFELAPGHSYSINIKYYVDTVNSGAPMMEYCAGLYTEGAPKYNYNTNENPLKYAGGRFAWFSGNVGKTVEATLTLDLTSLTNDTNYDIATNTYNLTYSSAEYKLYNYFYLAVTNGKAVVDIVSLEITRDDYVPETNGTVEYIDTDGKVLKSEEAGIGSYSINYIPENTAEKYFAGWYLDKDLTDKVESSPLSLTASGLKLYAKWEEYKDSVTSTDPNYYYGTLFAPNLTAAGVYSDKMSSRSSVSLTTITGSSDKLSLSTTFWGDGILLTAADDTTGELFRAKPNTTYKVSLKFRITAETTRADGVDVAIAAGAGLPDTNTNYPMGKYWDENNLKSRLAYTKYLDGVTEEGKYETYTALYTTGDFTTIPAIGVELWLYQDAAVEIYSISVSEFDGEELSEGEFLVSDEVENNTTYMVNFDYSLTESPSADIGIGFKTTAADTIGYPSFIEGENVAIYTVSADKTVGEWYTATALITTDMMASVVNSYGCDDILTALNTNLYGYVIGEESNKIAVKNIKVKALTDIAGNDLVEAVGGQCLTSEAEATAGSQALRYSFTYDTVTGSEIIIDGKEYAVLERGFIYTNGNNYAKGGIYKANFNLTNAKAGKFNFNSKTTGLDVCWKYSAIENTDYYSLTFSTFVKDFDVDDTKEMMIKAFVVIEIDGQEFTVYSDSVNRSVAYLKSLA